MVLGVLTTTSLIAGCAATRVETMSHPTTVHLRLSDTCQGDVVLDRHNGGGVYQLVSIDAGKVDVVIPSMGGGYTERGGTTTDVSTDYEVLRLRSGDRVFHRGAERTDIAFERACRGASLVERIASLADHDCLWRVARDRCRLVLGQQTRRARAGAIDADDDPARVTRVDAATGNPAVPVLVVVDCPLTNEVLAIDGEDIVHPQISHGPFQELVSSARSELFLRSATCERFAALVRSDPYGRNAAQHGEHHEQDPNHGGNIYAAVHQRNTRRAAAHAALDYVQPMGPAATTASSTYTVAPAGRFAL
jgi:hypothetical protein